MNTELGKLSDEDELLMVDKQSCAELVSKLDGMTIDIETRLKNKMNENNIIKEKYTIRFDIKFIVPNYY